MHGGGYGGLAMTFLVILSGVVSLLSFFVIILLSTKHSVHGVRGVALFLVMTTLLISLATAVENFLWDVLLLRSYYVNTGICVMVAYLAPLVFFSRLYRKESRNRLNKALLVCLALLAVLIGIWYIAETAN